MTEKNKKQKRLKRRCKENVLPFIAELKPARKK